jgi:hypothetical protein
MGIVWWNPDPGWDDRFLPAEFCVHWILSPKTILFNPGWVRSFLSPEFSQKRIRKYFVLF